MLFKFLNFDRLFFSNSVISSSRFVFIYKEYNYNCGEGKSPQLLSSGITLTV